MSKDVYERGLVSGQAFAARTAVVGRLVAVLDVRTAGRGLNLISPLSRAVLKYEIHELLVTLEPSAAPGKMVDEVAYLGFFEVREGGIILVGDRLIAGRREIGQIVGFDLTHFPNHMNIVARSATLATGHELGLQLGELITFSSAPSP